MITVEPPRRTRNEALKESAPLLQGTIAQALSDTSLDRFTDDDYEFLKFHGAYQQDDRDKRKVAKHYMLMVRTKFPGGVLSAEQYLVCDDLARRYGNNTLRSDDIIKTDLNMLSARREIAAANSPAKDFLWLAKLC